jgi:hypothetical protein
MLHAKLLIPSRLCINLHISDPKRNFCLFLVLAPCTDPEPVAFFRPHFRGWVAPR